MMQDGCDEILPAVLISTKYGDDALRSLNDADTPHLFMVYGPRPQVQNGRQNTVFLFLLQKSNVTSS